MAPIHIRSSLYSLVTCMKGVIGSMRDEHVKGMNETPFNLLFKAFYEGKIQADPKNNDLLSKIMDAYNVESNEFSFGTASLSITANDISVIFGIPKVSESKKMAAPPIPSGPEHPGKMFVKRYFDRVSQVHPNNIENACAEAVKGTTKQDVRDFCVLVCCLMFNCLLMPSSSGSLAKETMYSLYACMDFVDWPEKICEKLILGVTGYVKYGSVPGGCVVALTYWLLEHIDICPMRDEARWSIPRIVRWDAKVIYGYLKIYDFDTLDNKKVTELILTEKEKLLTKGRNVRISVKFDDSLMPADEGEASEQQAAYHNALKTLEDQKRENDELHKRIFKLEAQVEELKKIGRHGLKRKIEEMTGTLEEKEGTIKKMKALTETLVGNDPSNNAKEKENLHRRIIELEKQLDAQEDMEMEIERLKRELYATKHIGGEDAEVKKKIDEMTKNLEEKKEELEGLVALNQVLKVKERKTNDELQEARKELIDALKEKCCILSKLSRLGITTRR